MTKWQQLLYFCLLHVTERICWKVIQELNLAAQSYLLGSHSIICVSIQRGISFFHQDWNHRVWLVYKSKFTNLYFGGMVFALWFWCSDPVHSLFKFKFSKYLLPQKLVTWNQIEKKKSFLWFFKTTPTPKP